MSKNIVKDIDELKNKLNIAKSGKKVYIGVKDKERYILGEIGKNPLIFIGVNPSKARLEDGEIATDPTITRIKKFTSNHGYDGWIMLNLYPQVNEKPNELDDDCNITYININMEVIKTVFECFPDSKIIASWGNAITLKSYLKDSLKNILTIDAKREWYCRGELTKKYNPRHPLFVRYEADIYKIVFDTQGNIIDRIKENNF